MDAQLREHLNRAKGVHSMPTMALLVEKVQVLELQMAEHRQPQASSPPAGPPTGGSETLPYPQSE